MSRILLTSFGSLGDVYPYLAIARGLKQRGHHTIIAMPRFYREMIERDGHEFRRIRPEIDPSDPAIVRRAMHRTRGPEVIVRELLMAPLRESHEDLLAAARDVDLMVTHPITFAGPIVAEQLGKKFVSTILSPLSMLSAYDLPIFPNMPMASRLSRRIGPRAGKVVIGMGKKITLKWSEPVFDLRGDVGLEDGENPMFEGQHSPFRVLALFSKVLAEPQPDWPAKTLVTGFAFYDQPREFPPELERFLDAGPPPVVFTLGSSAVMAAGSFYRESVAAVKSLGVRAVLLIGSDPDNRTSEPLPPGVIACDYAPHAKLFPRAAAIVHHGGIGTTGEALRAGRPMLIVPHSHDQPDNAFRITNLGVGLGLPAHKYTAARLKPRLTTLLQPDVARRAEEVSRTVRSEDGVASACAAIEEQLR